MPRRSEASQPIPSSSRSHPSRSQRAEPSSSETPAVAAVDPELDQHVINMVRTILNLSVNKHPIKKIDLVRNALAGNGRLFAKVIPQAMNELSDVYGYKLIEMEHNKTYLLMSKLPCASILELNEDYRRKYTLLYLVLGYIFMKNGSVPEQGLWDFLAKLQIRDDQEHSFFGNVRKLITETFAKQAYLVRVKQVVEGMNDDRFFYSWGVRAEHELSKKDILESICKLLGKPSICYVTQYTAVYGDTMNRDEEPMEVANGE
ncbi:non-structural maintenance of chromosomes element 3 homolog [Wyeomyia smithii]|uniref:non-structural maintenance of chromosomes element 3 homolog n=1 Tax=Wyeomyia smithii TaxID=174621 RepID=UPI002467C0AB|nr:non-structural maintenance of chromosomes element 3 homolog [Wyeomyia smithii]